MAILRSAAASPFGRKCKIAASILGLTDQVTVEAADTNDPADSIRTQNPLGKIPALVLDDGEVIYDSAVIVAYLDHLAGSNRLYPADPMGRIRTQTLEALADGIMDASILQVYEVRYRNPEERSESWTQRQADKVARGLAALEAGPPAATGAANAGTIAVACALGYLDFRFEGAWRQTYPGLVAWLDAFRSENPSFDQTAPQ
ncbi:MAG: glutathione S-transferase N-terminal domain-containing protein [Devosiaceae bacterium]|nr:glutathione S-transferase N-terminal domain-containing protein [Devosiaceae bacterium MH13]